MRKGKNKVIGQINVGGDIQSLAQSIAFENDPDTVIEFILAIDLAFSEIGFSEDLFTKLAISIAKEGDDACDMESIVSAARKG